MSSVDQHTRRWERLEELFARAIELPRERRAAFAESETASDPELRAELLALLDHDTGAAGRIAQAIGNAAKAASLTTEWAGRRFGPYRIVREIGRGGMGMVFEALHDDDEYRKTVSLKIGLWWHDVDLLRERFRHERQILAGLEHPNIARFLDGGTQDGIPYFAMEYVEGCPITEYARRRGLKLRDRIELFRQVCAAVQYAHQNLLVHRDLKPGNILVNEEGLPKLLDFGIAKLLSPAPEAAFHTLTGTAPWTPHYASPEQVQGRPITTRTDVYSLGLILFELLVGERAQKADPSSPAAASNWEARCP
jgi:eukaryotic-like serine/threonine-protein kinase